MNYFLLLTIFIVIVTVCARPETYTDEYDNMDIDEILANKRLVDNYLNCIKTGQKCTQEGLKAREILPDALKTKCAKCTEKQKQNAEKILEFAIQNRPDDFLDVEAQFDPDHHYRTEYENELKQRNILLPALK